MTKAGEMEPVPEEREDETLGTLRKAARAVSEVLGTEAASAHEEWTYEKGRRYVSWAWLAPSQRGPQNCGFEFSRRGGREYLLAWGWERTLRCEGPGGLASFPGLMEHVFTLLTWSWREGPR